MILKGNTIGKNTTKTVMEIMSSTTIPPMPEVKSPKKEKIKRIYEDDDFIVDLFTEDKTVRVSVFEDGHFKDEVFVRKDEYV